MRQFLMTSYDNNCKVIGNETLISKDGFACDVSKRLRAFMQNVTEGREVLKYSKYKRRDIEDEGAPIRYEVFFITKDGTEIHMTSFCNDVGYLSYNPVTEKWTFVPFN